jgi:hypothetical protein
MDIKTYLFHVVESVIWTEVYWGQLISTPVVPKSWIKDITLVAQNQPWWEYSHQGNGKV